MNTQSPRFGRSSTIAECVLATLILFARAEPAPASPQLDNNGLAAIIAAGNAAMTAPPQAFTDDPLAAGSSVIKAAHITELRARIDVLRARYGLGAYSYTRPEILVGASLVKAVDVTELRTALSEAYTAAGLTAPGGSTSPGLNTAIVVADIADLRADVQAIE